ncbi:hypothetical protein JKY72_02325 [Candidatus Gracilibacteria bacterium]|nr:hypothetical protein [Candidatus Gracilibacteria bacterium]
MTPESKRSLSSAQEIGAHMMRELPQVNDLVEGEFQIENGAKTGEMKRENKEARGLLTDEVLFLLKSIYSLKGGGDLSKLEMFLIDSKTYLQSSGLKEMELLMKETVNGDAKAANKKMAEIYAFMKMKLDNKLSKRASSGKTVSSMTEMTRDDVGASLPPDLQKQLGFNRANLQDIPARGTNTRRMSGYRD